MDVPTCVLQVKGKNEQAQNILNGMVQTSAPSASAADGTITAQTAHQLNQVCGEGTSGKRAPRSSRLCYVSPHMAPSTAGVWARRLKRNRKSAFVAFPVPLYVFVHPDDAPPEHQSDALLETPQEQSMLATGEPNAIGAGTRDQKRAVEESANSTSLMDGSLSQTLSPHHSGGTVTFPHGSGGDRTSDDFFMPTVSPVSHVPSSPVLQAGGPCEATHLLAQLGTMAVSSGPSKASRTTAVRLPPTRALLASVDRGQRQGVTRKLDEKSLTPNKPIINKDEADKRSRSDHGDGNDTISRSLSGSLSVVAHEYHSEGSDDAFEVGATNDDDL